MPAKTKLSDFLEEDINSNKNLNCEGKTLLGSFLVQFIRWQPLQSQDKHFKLTTSWHLNKSTALKISSVHFWGSESTLSRLHINPCQLCELFGNFLTFSKCTLLWKKFIMFPQSLFFLLGYSAVFATTLRRSMNRRQCMKTPLFNMWHHWEPFKVKKCTRRYAASNLWNGFQYVWDASIVLKPRHTSWQVSKAWQPQLFEACCNHCGWSWCTCLLVSILCKWGSLWKHTIVSGKGG